VITWTLECSGCTPARTRDADGFPGVCDVCGSPYLVRYSAPPSPEAKTHLRTQRWTMWRYDMWLPLAEGEHPITLGEGGTPLVHVERLAARHGFDHLWVKDESTNPTGSFKARGLAVAVTRAVLAGAKQFVVPTAGNAGVALAAYAARAGARARVYAPATTPRPILEQIRAFGGDLMLLDGHIGDCGSRPGCMLRTPVRSTSRRCASRTASKARRRSASSWPSRWVGHCPTPSCIPPVAAQG